MSCNASRRDLFVLSLTFFDGGQTVAADRPSISSDVHNIKRPKRVWIHTSIDSVVVGTTIPYHFSFNHEDFWSPCHSYRLW